MQTTHYITLDLHDMISPVVVNVKQTDTARWLEITLSEDGRAVEIPEGTTGTISFVWQGSSGVYGVPTISGNKITYKLPSEVTASPGRKHAEIALRKMVNNEIEEQLYTASFDVLVYGVTVANAQASDDSYEALDELLGQASAFLANKLITDVSYDAATDTLTISLVDGDGNESTKTLTGLKGADGADGVGISSVTTTAIPGGTAVHIHTTDGESYPFYVYNGDKGDKGDKGDPGDAYVLPPATSSTLGGIIAGANVSIDANGVLSVPSGGGSLPVYVLDWYDSPTYEQKEANRLKLIEMRSLSVGAYVAFVKNGNEYYQATICQKNANSFVLSAVDTDNEVFDVYAMKLSVNSYSQSFVSFIDQEFDPESGNTASMAAIAEYIDDLLADKQDTLTAGTGIDITNNVISATGGGGGTSYTAGTGIDITNNAISVDTSTIASRSYVDGIVGDVATLIAAL